MKIDLILTIALFSNLRYSFHEIAPQWKENYSLVIGYAFIHICLIKESLGFNDHATFLLISPDGLIISFFE